MTSENDWKAYYYVHVKETHLVGTCDNLRVTIWVASIT